MPTMFPKGYIIERIDARLASIASREEQDVTKVARGADAKRALWVEHAEALNGWAMVLAEQAGAIVLAREAGTLAVEDVEQAVRDLDPKPPQNPAERWERHMTPAQRDLAQRVSEGEGAERRLTEQRRERMSLEHARAYLVDTPVEAFSKTDLRDLNLLGVVAFRLEAVRG